VERLQDIPNQPESVTPKIGNEERALRSGKFPEMIIICGDHAAAPALATLQQGNELGQVATV
jgi:hypothetical protein